MSSATSKTNQKLLMKSEALKQIHEHNRDFLSLTLTLPLGNDDLKKVHTNQWLFTDLPAEFDLANWTILAEALQSSVNRNEKYIKNKWYIEAVDINVEAGGKAEMKLTLNAFASSYSSYTDMAKDMKKAYTDATTKNTTTTKNKNKSSAVTNKKTVLHEKNIKNMKIPSDVVKQVEKICKVNWTDMQNVKAIFKWMDGHIAWWEYYNHKYSESQVLRQGGGNCVDNSRLFRMFCRAIGVKCNFIKNSCISHQYNKVYIDGKGYIVDVGRQCASWGSHWGSGGCPSETTHSW